MSDANESITHKLTHVALFSKSITIIPTHKFSYVNGWKLKGEISVRTSIGRSSPIYGLSVHVLKAS